MKMFEMSKKGFRRGFGSVMGFLTDQFDERVIEKFLERGDIKYLIVNSLGKKSMHGYQIITDIEKDFQGLYSPSPGAIYPTLQMLEEAGLVSCKKEEGRKTYSLTKKGKKDLKDNRLKVERILSRVLEHKNKHWFGGEMRVLTREYSKLGREVFKSAYNTYSAGDSKLEKKIRDVEKILEKARDEVVKIWSS
jgi:DNA-binding PadR family transcriptional regulator